MRAPVHFLVILIGFVVGPVFAEADPPGRVARVNYTEGTVSFAPAGDNEFTDAELNRPLVRGDKLWTDKGVRAELQAGSAAVRMDGRTQLTVLALDDQSTQLSVTQGTVYVRVRTLPEGENFEIDTPNLAWRASYPGDYRIDVDPQRGITRVTIHSGTGAVYGEKGQALPMGGGQQITFKGRALAQVDAKDQPPQDNFDRWAAERNRREDQSVAARYVPREVVGYQLLDAAGQWQQDAGLGVVWIPQSVPAQWAPYRHGRWEPIAPWGWTWIDDQPWAFVTSHYGRWAMVGNKWAWVPGRMGVRPMYAPALVAFVGNANGPLSVAGKHTVAWFPLAPGEAWQPGYQATQLYISSVNANMPPQPPAKYAHQGRTEALTAIAADDFARGKPSKGSWLQVAANALSNSQVVAPPAMPERPAKTMVARATTADIKPAIDNRRASQQQQLEAQKLAQQDQERAQREQREQLAKAEQARAAAEQARRAGQQKAAEQQKLAQQQRAAEQQKVAEQQRAAEQQKLAQQRAADQQKVAQQRAAEQKAAEQQRIAQQQQRAAEQQRIAQHRAAEQQKVAQQRAAEQKAAEQARREAVAARRAEQAKREQAVAARREKDRREQVAKAREQRELQARRAQDARKLALAAKKDEDARRHAQVEQARRAAEREAVVVATQRAEREAAIRRVAEDKERERAQREAWQKQQQALAEQWRREQQAYEEEQRRKALRGRPDLRRSAPPQSEPEVWQRGIPILQPGRTS